MLYRLDARARRDCGFLKYIVRQTIERECSITPFTYLVVSLFCSVCLGEGVRKELVGESISRKKACCSKSNSTAIKSDESSASSGSQKNVRHSWPSLLSCDFSGQSDYHS